MLSALVSRSDGYIWLLPIYLQTAFDLFLIVLIIVNGLSIPHQTQADVMYNLQKDGARWFAVSCSACFIQHLLMSHISQALFGKIY